MAWRCFLCPMAHMSRQRRTAAEILPVPPGAKQKEQGPAHPQANFALVLGPDRCYFNEQKQEASLHQPGRSMAAQSTN